MAQTTQPSLVASLFRTKPAEQIVAEGGQGEGGGLRRSMTLFQLTLFSVGATLGTGIFIVLGSLFAARWLGEFELRRIRWAEPRPIRPVR